MAGIGGTGVSTVSAIMVMAARIDKKWSQSMNFTGLAQKNGAVTSQIRISKDKTLYEKNQPAYLTEKCRSLAGL